MSNRLFIAVPIRMRDYDSIRHTFSPCIQGRWREENTLHATVAFLGEVFSADSLLKKLEGFDWSFEPTAFDRFDYFVKSRVFVATSFNPSLQLLRNRLSNVLGLPDDQIKPHITLMRVKSIIDTEIFYARMKEYSALPVAEMKPSVILYESHLHPEGARYTPLREWVL